MIKLIIASFVLCSCLAHGRIGETVEECRKRYGKESLAEDVVRDIKILLFKKNSISIRCQFYKDECIKLTYDFPEKALLNKALPSSVVLYLLGINTSGEQWVRIKGEDANALYFQSSITFSEAYNKAGVLDIKSRKWLILNGKKGRLKDASDPANHPLLKGL